MCVEEIIRCCHAFWPPRHELNLNTDSAVPQESKPDFGPFPCSLAGDDGSTAFHGQEREFRMDLPYLVLPPGCHQVIDLPHLREERMALFGESNTRGRATAIDSQLYSSHCHSQHLAYFGSTQRLTFSRFTGGSSSGD